MVKSKKMSKTGIAVIILALLLVLSMVMSLTGAWFTQSGTGSDTGNVQNLQFGTIGEVSITVGATQWKDAAGTNLIGGERSKFMPGDSLKTGDITLSYATGATDTVVWYLVKDVTGSKYYVVDGDAVPGANSDPATGKFVAIANAAAYETNKTDAKITAGTPLVVKGEFVAIQIDGLYYSLNGEVAYSSSGNDGSTLAKAKNSGEIPTDVQNVLLSTLSPEVNGFAFNFSAQGNEYKVAVVQTTNLTSSETAYTELKAVLDAVVSPDPGL